MLAVTNFLNQEILNQPLYRYFQALGVIFIGFLAARLVRLFLEARLKKLFTRLGTESALKASLAISRPTAFAITALSIYYAVWLFNIPQEFVGLIQKVLKVLVGLVVAYGVYRLIDFADAYLSVIVKKTETKLDDMMLPLFRKTLKVVVVIVAFLIIVQNAGYDVTTLLAGVGIGGLAIALAGKDLLANFFGSVMIFTERPFKVGDRISISGYDGPVEEVGLRTSKIRTLTGHLVTIPNSTLANTPVENISARPNIRRLFRIGITYDSGYEKMKRAVEIIKEVLSETPGIEENFFVHFSDFADSCLEIFVLYWVSPPDYLNHYLPTNERVNLEILRRFNQEGIEFAFPTQTVHLVTEGPRRPSI